DGERARALFTEHGDWEGEARALNVLSFVHSRLRHYEEAAAYTALALFRDMQGLSLKIQGSIHANHAHALHRLRRPKAALPHYQQALALATRRSDPLMQGVIASGLGAAYAALGRPGDAESLYAEAIARLHEIGAEAQARLLHNNLAALQSQRGDHRAALDSYHRALTLARDLKDARNEAIICTNIGEVWATLEDPLQAADWWELSSEAYRSCGEHEKAAEEVVKVYTTLWDIAQDRARAAQRRELALRERLEAAQVEELERAVEELLAVLRMPQPGAQQLHTAHRALLSTAAHAKRTVRERVLQ